MKKILLLLFFALPVQAQVILDQQMYCVDSVTLEKTIIEFKETPVIQFLSSRSMGGSQDKTTEVPAVLYVNMETQTWTFVEKPSEDMFCIVAHGQGINIFDDRKQRI